MVLEVKDDKIPFYKQYVSVIIIVICCIVMALQYLDGYFGTGTMLIGLAFRPDTLLKGEPISILTLFTSMFMHGDIVHLIMNLWFFYVVADNCEKALGHLGFLLTYLASGLFATFLHTMTSVVAGMVLFQAGAYSLYPILEIPSLGASGAIFGMIGVYGILFPKTKLAILANPLSGSSKVSKTINAQTFIVLYVIAEISYGIYGIINPLNAGSTAHFAHVGGFIIGAMVAYIYVWRKESKSKKK